MKPALGTELVRVTGITPDWKGEMLLHPEICTVVKHTPKGVRLKRPYVTKLKFQLDDGGRYASATLPEAVKAFEFRRIRYCQILENQLEFAKQELELTKAWKPAPLVSVVEL